MRELYFATMSLSFLRMLTDPAAASTPSPLHRPAASYRLRRRSLSPKRQRELVAWSAAWAIDPDGDVLAWPDVFGRSAPVVLDVGFGHGESTIAMARDRRDVDVLGVEVHTPGVVTVLDAVANDGLRNIRVVHGDVLTLLARIGPGTLDGVRIFFPDPWTKRRNHHRRLVAPDVVAAVCDRLVIGGTLHLATDIADYAVAMGEAANGDLRLAGGVIDRPEWRPYTRFERRGIAADQTVRV